MGGLNFCIVLSDEDDYDVPDSVMKPILSRLVESEERTLVNEAASGSLLQTYTEGFESRDIAGQIHGTIRISWTRTSPRSSTLSRKLNGHSVHSPAQRRTEREIS